MAMPPIDPTGAMSSGDYVNYMMTYNSEAADAVYEDLGNYFTTSTSLEWNTKWTTVLNRTASDITTLEEAVRKMTQQVRMMSDAIKKL